MVQYNLCILYNIYKHIAQLRSQTEEWATVETTHTKERFSEQECNLCRFIFWMIGLY